ncbi:L-threonylcarbamoyladenylate synthase [Planctomycetota bacterium]
MIKIDPANIEKEKIKKAAELIDAGALVAFPTETVYGIACRARSDSLAKLSSLKERSSEKHFTLHVAQPNDVDSYVPTIKLNAKKLIQNAWPGPLTIVFDLDKPDIEKQRKKLEQDVIEHLYKNDSLGIRCPDHPIATTLLRQAFHPVVAPSANLAGEPPSINGDQVVDRFSGQIDMLLDAGPTKYGLNSTIVKIGKNGIEVLRPGVFSEEHVKALSRIKFLFVCTGNTCRSPMAEGIFRKYLAEKINANVDEIEKIGYTVESAGMIGSIGFPASPESVVACTAKGVNIEAHRNKRLSKALIEESDYIFVMESVHRAKVLALVPQAADRCLLLKENGQIPDPIGRPQSDYDRCAEQIERAVKNRISELVI